MIWWEGESVQTNIGRNQTMEPLRPLLLGKDFCAFAAIKTENL
jgi:hypothetical protein